jgi:hypothetical protein
LQATVARSYPPTRRFLSATLPLFVSTNVCVTVSPAHNRSQ